MLVVITNMSTSTTLTASHDPQHISHISYGDILVIITNMPADAAPTFAPRPRSALAPAHGLCSPAQLHNLYGKMAFFRVRNNGIFFWVVNDRLSATLYNAELSPFPTWKVRARVNMCASMCTDMRAGVHRARATAPRESSRRGDSNILVILVTVTQ